RQAGARTSSGFARPLGACGSLCEFGSRLRGESGQIRPAAEHPDGGGHPIEEVGSSGVAPSTDPNTVDKIHPTKCTVRRWRWGVLDLGISRFSELSGTFRCPLSDPGVVAVRPGGANASTCHDLPSTSHSARQWIDLGAIGLISTVTTITTSWWVIRNTRRSKKRRACSPRLRRL